MGADANGEWDGICACGKVMMDGVRCFLGATHKPYKPRPMPWEIRCDTPKDTPAPSFPWELK